MAHSVAVPETGVLMKDSYYPGNPINISEDSDFVKLLFNSDIVIDKSVLIKEVMEDENQLLLITAPRCWGKTVNVKMIKTFLQIPVDSQGNAIEPINSEAYRLFTKGEMTINDTTKKFRFPPLIAEHKPIIDAYLGKYPVIYVNLYFGGINFVNMISGFLHSISKVFEEYAYIMDRYNLTAYHPKVDNQTKKDVRWLMTKYHLLRTRNDSINHYDITMSLNLLSGLLYQYFGEKVVIILDEYIVPLEASGMTPIFTNEDKKTFLNCYFTFIESTLIKNTHLHKAILVGIIPPMQELRRFFPTTTEVNMLTGKFMEYYSINQWELKELYNFLNTPVPVQEEIDNWYKGYHVNHNDLVVYNVLSLARVLSEAKGARYWINTANMELFFGNYLQSDIFKEKFTNMINGKEIVAQSNHMYLLLSEYDVLVKTAHSIFPVSEESADKALVFLYHLGYLTLSQHCDIIPHYMKYHFRFPNKEVTSAMNETLCKFAKLFKNYTTQTMATRKRW